MNGPTIRVVARNNRKIPPKPVTAPDDVAAITDKLTAIAGQEVAAIAVQLARLYLLEPYSVRAVASIVDKLVEKAEDEKGGA